MLQNVLYLDLLTFFFKLLKILHGEQYLEIVDTLPVEGSLFTKSKVVEVIDKKSGAVVVTQSIIFILAKTNNIITLYFQFR